ncbi:DNA-binding WRKY [Cynara cardunculus var. scolymus]|uniref:DNA-binding WRKY n=1 Tax=Cynara cardunculus var. scolymus TaxID=59895 RepID=A0A118JYP2_CYNCS|nr:DNA-binding WRKY [Cynara cardunculus var. scolymus]
MIPPMTEHDEEAGDLAEELNRVNMENKKLTQMIKSMNTKYNLLQSRLSDYVTKNPDRSAAGAATATAKRKPETPISGNSESNSSNEINTCKKPTKDEHNIRPKISRVFVRSEASKTGLVVKDGYQWRKYGQKVQRSVEDQTIVVATYEGEHNHPQPSRHELVSPGLRQTVTAAKPWSTVPTVTLDLTNPLEFDGDNEGSRITERSELQQFLVGQWHLH